MSRHAKNLKELLAHLHSQKPREKITFYGSMVIATFDGQDIWSADHLPDIYNCTRGVYFYRGMFDLEQAVLPKWFKDESHEGGYWLKTTNMFMPFTVKSTWDIVDYYKLLEEGMPLDAGFTVQSAHPLGVGGTHPKLPFIRGVLDEKVRESLYAEIRFFMHGGSLENGKS